LKPISPIAEADVLPLVLEAVAEPDCNTSKIGPGEPHWNSQPGEKHKNIDFSDVYFGSG